MQYELTAHLKPGSSQLSSAVLSPSPPGGVDIGAFVVHAKASGGLPTLLMLVQGALFDKL